MRQLFEIHSIYIYIYKYCETIHLLNLQRQQQIIRTILTKQTQETIKFQKHII